MLDNITSCNDPCKATSVVNNGKKVLIHYLQNKLIKLSCDLYRRIPALADIVADDAVAHFLGGKEVVVHYRTKKVTLADSSDVNSVAVDNGDSGVAAASHAVVSFFKGIIVIKKFDCVFWVKQIQNIHSLSVPFPFAGLLKSSVRQNFASYKICRADFVGQRFALQTIQFLFYHIIMKIANIFYKIEETVENHRLTLLKPLKICQVVY